MTIGKVDGAIFFFHSRELTIRDSIPRAHDWQTSIQFPLNVKENDQLLPVNVNSIDKSNSKGNTRFAKT